MGTLSCINNKNIMFENTELLTSSKHDSTSSIKINSNNKLEDYIKQNNLIDNDAFGISYENQKLGETIVKIEISESEENKNIGEFIIILDISESMGNYVTQILNDVIPKALDKLNYDETKKCHLITFSDESNIYHLTKKEFKSSGIKANGYTQMLGVLKKLKNIIDSINEDEFTNI